MELGHISGTMGGVSLQPFDGTVVGGAGMLSSPDIIITKATNGFIVTDGYQKLVFTSYGQIAKWLKSKVPNEAHKEV